MYYFQQGREWEMNSIETECFKLFTFNSNYSHCILQYEINVTRYSSMYYSSIIVPAVGMKFIRVLTDIIFN